MGLASGILTLTKSNHVAKGVLRGSVFYPLLFVSYLTSLLLSFFFIVFFKALSLIFSGIMQYTIVSVICVASTLSFVFSFLTHISVINCFFEGALVDIVSVKRFRECHMAMQNHVQVKCDFYDKLFDMIRRMGLDYVLVFFFIDFKDLLIFRMQI